MNDKTQILIAGKYMFFVTKKVFIVRMGYGC